MQIQTKSIFVLVRLLQEYDRAKYQGRLQLKTCSVSACLVFLSQTRILLYVLHC